MESGFATTRWTRVFAAKDDTPDAGEALRELAAAYYAPVHAFIRAALRDDEAARDATQEFFARVLEQGNRAFSGANPERGRFRSFLLGAVKNVLADLRDRASAKKRGGGASHEPLPDTDFRTGHGIQIPDPRATPDDAFFDRQWATTLLERALIRLGDDLASRGRAEHFRVLKPWLTGNPATPQSAAAAELGIEENAVKVAIHRLRQRFRELVKEEISHTVSDPAEQAAELQHLIAAVAAG